MTKRILLVALLIIIVGAGAVAMWMQYSSKNSPPAEIPVPANNAPATAQDHKNIAYEVDGESIVLVNGVSEVAAADGSASKTITRYFGNEATGDLDEDSTNDVAFLLTQEGGGSGTFFYAVVALKTGAGYKGTNAILLGDRIAPQTTEIRNGYLIVNYADRAENEPMTARPSMGKSKYLVVENGALAETPVFIESPEKGAAISSPLTVRGVAKGPWYFEASFPLLLLDESGNTLAQSHATAQGEWMTTEYVRFAAALEFTAPAAGGRGTLIFKKDNPSGLPEHDDSREVPVIFK